MTPDARKALRRDLRQLRQFQRYERKIVRALGHVPRVFRGVMFSRAMERANALGEPDAERPRRG